MKLVCYLFAICSLPSMMTPEAFADDDASKLAAAVIRQAGSEEKLLDVFRFRERVLISSNPTPLPGPDEKGNRTSTVKVGGDWWINTSKRDKDKVRVLLWAWSLRILKAPNSKLESIAESEIAGKKVVGLQVSGCVKESLDLYFDSTDLQLVAIDYMDTRHVFSEWKATTAGHRYPSHVVGYRFTDRAKKTVQTQQWYQTDILELTPLPALPPELK